MKITDSGIEFDNVTRASTSINDNIRQTVKVKVDSYSFANANSKGDFKQVNSIEDLKDLHSAGSSFAKSTFAMMNNEWLILCKSAYLGAFFLR